MYPVNQVFLGSDPLLTPSRQLNNISNLEEQIQYLQNQKQLLEETNQQRVVSQPRNLIWNEIDAEVSPMTEEQKSMLFQNEEYVGIYNELQTMVQSELLNLVKGRIENTEKGRNLLSSQLKLVKKLKSNIVDTTNREMEMFKRFREFSKQNPNITYDEFIKLNLKKDGSE